jgi:hypothetical protein
MSHQSKQNWCKHGGLGCGPRTTVVNHQGGGWTV